MTQTDPGPKPSPVMALFVAGSETCNASGLAESRTILSNWPSPGAGPAMLPLHLHSA
jgi:hypothetical protein